MFSSMTGLDEKPLYLRSQFSIIYLIKIRLRNIHFWSKKLLGHQIMQRQGQFHVNYNPPFFLHKIQNYEKAVYERKGHWTQKQKIKYGVFLEIFRVKFQNKDNPILNKMFRVMSDFVKTRNHNQCRSHHQKMERERFEIQSILDSIKSKYHPREYEVFFEKYSRHIKALNVDVVLNQKGFTPHKNVEKRRKKTQRKDNQNTQGLNMSLRIKQNQEQSSGEIKNEINDAIQVKQVEESYIINQEKSEEEQNVLKSDKYVKQPRPLEQSIGQYLNESQLIIKNIEQKDEKAQKRTGLQYDSDDQQVNDSPKVAYVQIPPQISMLSNKAHNGFDLAPAQVQRSSHRVSLPLIRPQPINQINLVDSLVGNQHFETQMMKQMPIGLGSFNFEESYTLQIKQLEQRKKWHLSEATRVCNQMNQHLQTANYCQKMKQMYMEQLMQLRRGFYYPNRFPHSQF